MDQSVPGWTRASQDGPERPRIASHTGGGVKLATFRLPANPLYLLSYFCHPSPGPPHPFSDPEEPAEPSQKTLHGIAGDGI
ncbi:unnamed protein product [Boreogadus saida]